MQLMVANPPDKRIKEIVGGSSIKNCPFEFNDVSNSSDIFGSNSNRLKGVITRQKPKMVKEEYLKIPKD